MQVHIHAHVFLTGIDSKPTQPNPATQHQPSKKKEALRAQKKLQSLDISLFRGYCPDFISVQG
jgi:hypothetical protein